MKLLPLHERIRTDIESQILSGAIGPGDKIASESGLMEVYGCARMTVNKALSRLSAAGLVDRRTKAGTFVAKRPNEMMVLDVPDLPVEIVRRGQAYRYRMIQRLERAASPHDEEEQRFAERGRLLFVSGVHIADDQPFAYEERLVSLNAVPEIAGADFTSEPPGSWLLRHIPWTEAENRIGAVGASAQSAEILHIPTGAACLTIDRRTWRGEKYVTHVHQQFVAGRYDLVARFGAVQRGS
ncbi:histidine utilization repressor [Novosphingobium sp. Rr 2-17]|uniref:UTRA domain-containing protein n=1 Tax=Novosphingobium sp. Rr 2-17 TaxID=555793 RepID=UPI0002697E8D|nr:UTRA domain-containing protein [Novosphingobium sp. Rr 2-17]EIZ80105.1 histidine utilization repressor [Novosphingobium sp. Rr 2-17]